MLRPALVAIALVLAGCGEEEPKPPPEETWPPLLDLSGTFAGGAPGLLETGEIQVTIQPTPSGTDAVLVRGLLRLERSPGTTSLVGTFDRQNVMRVDDVSYFFTGTLSGRLLVGTYTGLGGRTGAVTLHADGLFSYCAEGGGGKLSFLETADRSLLGDSANLGGYTGPVTGKREGDSFTLASPDGALTLTAARIAEGGVIEGDHRGPSGSGTWQGAFCAP